ncbi:asparagine synthase-related protein [Sphingobium sp. Cam5-1]|uniref:asparagine synthase-related protein n=1 Tax=Sphingobium sp. Cam5-1 TaxID=2789327 RepID=UPI0018AD24E8|nr:asparagine synthetase B family protein [Sphingobium sp. Cam5-1]QPI72229.1 asparagine synthetase B family protein [Sphingobium sp. Cam5-1]
MGRRFLAMLAITDQPIPRDRIEMARKDVTSLTPLIETDRFMLWSDHRHGIAHAAGHAVIGEIFDRGSTRPEITLDETMWIAIAQSRGQKLIERYWGSYVAFITGDAAVTILRAPMGDLGCYYIRLDGVLMIASDLALLSDLGCRFAVDPYALARHIAHPEWRRTETCLENLKELRGGDRLVASAEGVKHETLWSPWSFVTRDRMIEDPREAARAVRNAVHLAVRARAAGHGRLVLLLSGGLDSAIVAASLKAADADVVGLNLIGDDAASDERHYAAMVARSAGVELLSRTFDAERVDVRRSGAAHMPYPVHRCFTQAQDAIAAEAAARCGADVLMDGGGGDNVFFASRTVSILADCLVFSGFDRRFWDAARALGDLGQAGTWALACRAAHRAWCRSPAPRQPPAVEFLSDAARATVDDAPTHPWFLPPTGVLPGRASHVALLAPAQNLVEAINAQALTRAISPLASQPVVEACLRIPSWHWLAPGRDRAAARQAFEPDLPEAIVSRRSKGTPTGFVAAIFERNRQTIRDMLLCGHLASLGLIDRNKISQAFATPGPVRNLRFVGIMELVDAEAWAAARS